MTDIDQETNETTEDPIEGSNVEEQPVEETRKVVRRKPSPTPFDHPLSFPILVGGLGLWFGYDWLFNPKIQSKSFNMWMFWICLVVFVLTIRLGLREMRMVREKKRKKAEKEMAKQAESAES